MAPILYTIFNLKYIAQVLKLIISTGFLCGIVMICQINFVKDSCLHIIFILQFLIIDRNLTDTNITFYVAMFVVTIQHYMCIWFNSQLIDERNSVKKNLNIFNIHEWWYSLCTSMSHNWGTGPLAKAWVVVPTRAQGMLGTSHTLFKYICRCVQVS